jgi:hypothetical protein
VPSFSTFSSLFSKPLGNPISIRISHPSIKSRKHKTHHTHTNTHTQTHTHTAHFEKMIQHAWTMVVLLLLMCTIIGWYATTRPSRSSRFVRTGKPALRGENNNNNNQLLFQVCMYLLYSIINSCSCPLLLLILLLLLLLILFLILMSDCAFRIWLGLFVWSTKLSKTIFKNPTYRYLIILSHHGENLVALIITTYFSFCFLTDSYFYLQFFGNKKTTKQKTRMLCIHEFIWW